MIELYSGTPGSGKSLHVARDIYIMLKHSKRNVIANFPINLDIVKNPKGRFFYAEDLSVKYLIDFAKKNHKRCKEGQTLLVIDECQTIFNPREFSRKDRLPWNNFFSQHRKFGYTVILVSQNDRLIDRQIRSLIEYNVIHRKVNNFGVGKLLPVQTFAAVKYWYGVREKLGMEFFICRRKYFKLYDTYFGF